MDEVNAKNRDWSPDLRWKARLLITLTWWKVRTHPNSVSVVWASASVVETHHSLEGAGGEVKSRKGAGEAEGVILLEGAGVELVCERGGRKPQIIEK